MIEKEFVLVSQGIEIMRTKSQEKAINIVKKENDEYFDYQQKCYDNYERPVDNYIDLEIEYSNEKEKDKEIERLNNIITELEEYSENMISEYNEAIKEAVDNIDRFNLLGARSSYREISNKIKELKGSDKE